MTPPADRRRAIRVVHPFVVRYLCPRGPTHGWSMGTAHDISRVGVRIRSECPLQIGDRVELYLFLPTRRSPARILASVVWSKIVNAKLALSDYGLDFQHLNADAQQALDAALAPLLRSPRDRPGS